MIKKDAKKGLTIRREGIPFFPLQREINRVFDTFSRGFFDVSPWESPWERVPMTFSPKVDVAETEKEVKVTAELPGMEEKDVEVSISREALTLKGEKKTESEEKGKGFHKVERSFGSFHRVIALPTSVETGKAEAAFKKGVLTVTIPKSPTAESVIKKIPVKGE